MDVEFDDSAEANQILRDALIVAGQKLEQYGRPLASLREKDLRDELFASLTGSAPGAVEKESGLRLEAFRGVGPFDLIVRRPDGSAAWLMELKWSYTDRSKIYESVWDAVKLCLAADQYDVAQCWVITGAPTEQWLDAESRALFDGGSVAFTSLWSERLDPRGPNGGATVGEDVIAGGRGNVFTQAPKAINVQSVATVDVARADEEWSLRAIAVTAAEWEDGFAPDPSFPSPMTQRWLERHVPEMEDETFDRLLDWLMKKRWTAEEVSERVLPLRRS